MAARVGTVPIDHETTWNPESKAPILVAMNEPKHPPSATGCAALLQSVLGCLDQVAIGAKRVDGDALALAAAHVQQAIELIQAVEQPNP